MCKQGDCLGKPKDFSTQRGLREHIRNIHTNPLKCMAPDCKRDRPFGRKSDLTRHVLCFHKGEEARIYKCQVKTCREHDYGFPRKDKLDQHMAASHRRLRCTITHCGATVWEGAEADHLSEGHGKFECALGACEAYRSSFTKWDLYFHLNDDHKIWRPGGDVPNGFFLRLENLGLATVRIEDIPRLYTIPVDQIRDCDICTNRSATE